MTTSSEPAVLVVREPNEPRILSLTLNRPRRLNAYDRAMRDGLYEGLGLAHSDPSIHVVVLRGAGRAFSSGGDLAEFGTAPSPVAAREIRQIRDVWNRLATLPAVTIAAIHGVAAGGGLEMAMLCDVLLSTHDARLGLPETGLGAIPGVGGTQTLPRAVGEGRAAAMLLAGQEIDGREAARVGLVSRSVGPERLEAVTRTWARRIAALDPGVAGIVREGLRRGGDLPLAEGLSLEKRLARRLRDETS